MSTRPASPWTVCLSAVDPSTQPTTSVLFTTGATTFTTIMPSGATWKYLDNGVNQGNVWRNVNFNDSSWSSGAAELGYGDGDETTQVGFGPDSNNKYRTTYFRKTFNASNIAQYQTLKVRLKRDDGAVVYLNGQEIVRSNMPTGTIAFDDFASGTVGGGDESTFYEFEVDVSNLQEGSNVLAVEVHQGERDEQRHQLRSGIALVAVSAPATAISITRSTAPTHGRRVGRSRAAPSTTTGFRSTWIEPRS